MSKPPYDYEARRSVGLRFNFDQLGFFNVHPKISTWAFFAFRPHQNAATVAAF